mmetsp:Transcript_53854/g.115546  ORF Transcript_53854/g.115546 Transcript_53854/m.115546 type:complete len:349 (+) Transcript_53854:3-1049(+)
MGLLASVLLSGANWNRPAETALLSYREAQTVRAKMELYTPVELVKMDHERLVQLVLSLYGPGVAETQKQLCPQCTGSGKVYRRRVSSVDDIQPEEFQEVHMVVCPSCSGSGLAPVLEERALVYRLAGPVNFLSVFRIRSLVEEIKKRHQETGRRVILDMHHSVDVDLTGAEALMHSFLELQEAGVPIALMNVSQTMEAGLSALGETESYATVEPEHEGRAVIVKQAAKVTWRKLINQMKARTQQADDEPMTEDREMLAFFRQFDSQNCGRISLAELETGLAALAIEVTREDLEDLFQQADLNKDGGIGMNEFVLVWKKMRLEDLMSHRISKRKLTDVLKVGQPVAPAA